MATEHESMMGIIELYKLRSEPTMRKARDWFITSFQPGSTQDILDVLFGEHSGEFRMVASYWDMAAAFVELGAIDGEMFNAINTEHVGVYAKLEPFLPTLREEMGNPNFLAHLEKVVKECPDYETKIANIRTRMAKLIELYQQRAAAQAAAAGN